MKKINQTSILVLVLFALSGVSSVWAKIADPKPLIDGNVRYESHRHTVWATDISKNKVLWKTKIPMAEYIKGVDPRLERDVQWNIISSLKREGKILAIKNSMGETFNLDSVTGKLLKKPVSVLAERSVLIHRAAVDKYINPKEFSAGLLSGTKFAAGMIGDQKMWQTFATKAGTKTGLPMDSGVDWERQVVLYVVLKVNSNGINFRKWIEPEKGVGELVFNWSGIEPYYGDRYPALLHVVERADLESVQFSYRTDRGRVGERPRKLGTIDLE